MVCLKKFNCLLSAIILCGVGLFGCSNTSTHLIWCGKEHHGEFEHRTDSCRVLVDRYNNEGKFYDEEETWLDSGERLNIKIPQGEHIRITSWEYGYYRDWTISKDMLSDENLYELYYVDENGVYEYFSVDINGNEEYIEDYK